MSFGRGGFQANISFAVLRCDLKEANGWSCEGFFPPFPGQRPERMTIEPEGEGIQGAHFYTVKSLRLPGCGRGEVHFPATEEALRAAARAAGWHRVRVADCWLDVCQRHPHGESEINK